MGRWRPAAPASTAVITREGHDRLKAELDDLWRVQRPEVVRALAAAAAEGDRSENAEYTYRKKQLGGIDRRVRYLGKRLQVLKVVETVPTDPEKVYFGATVELDPVDGGEPRRYRIVGPDETDAKRGWISVDAPLARALLGRRVDDEVHVRLPAGDTTFVIGEITYA
jgi:transcription elongation factor GreB